MSAERPLIIDGLQYCNWSPEIFAEMDAGGVTCVHATICYWETLRETIANISAWNLRFEAHAGRLVHVRTAEDVRRAQAEGKTGIVFDGRAVLGAEPDSRLALGLGAAHVLGGA